MDVLHWWLATSVAKPMALKRLRYRISRFGTIALPQEVRRATFCIMKLELQAVRGVTYYSRERIPAQTVHGWITARDADGYVVNKDWDWRFDRQRWLLWESTDFQVTLNQCFIANKQTEVLLTELAKKPNTPPLPPSLPPINYDNFFGKVPIIIHGYESITVNTRVGADFDIELVYDTREESRCSPVPTEIPRGPAPIENSLPRPGGNNGIAPGPVFPVAQLPVNSSPLGGTSTIPEGYQGADQSRPPTPPLPNGRYSVVVNQKSFKTQSGGCIFDFDFQRTFLVQQGPASLQTTVNAAGGRTVRLIDRNGASQSTLQQDSNPNQCETEWSILSQVIA